MINFKNIVQVLLLVYIVIVFSSAFILYSFLRDQILFFALVVGIGSLLLLLEFFNRNTILKPLTILFFFWSFFFIISAINNDSYKIEFLILLLAQIGFGTGLVRVKIKWVFIIFNTLLFFEVLSYLLLGMNLSYYMIWSRNTISIYSIAFFAMYYISLINNSSYQCKTNYRLEIWVMATLTFVISVMAVGRGGIIASFIILMFLFIELSKNKTTMIIIISISVLFIIFLQSKIYAIYGEVYSYTKFGIEGFGTERYNIYSSYLSSLDFNNIIFGSKSNEPEFVFWDGGSHNSYILTHMHMGLGVLGILYIILYSMTIFYKCREFVLLGIILSISVRAFSDTHLIRGNYLQFGIMIALYIIAIRIKKRSERIQNS